MSIPGTVGQQEQDNRRDDAQQRGDDRRDLAAVEHMCPRPPQQPAGRRDTPDAAGKARESIQYAPIPGDDVADGVVHFAHLRTPSSSGRRTIAATLTT